MKYCIECGTKLIEKELKNEGIIPYCPTCKEYRFPVFNSAISTVIFNQTKDKILLIQQYGRNSNILVAGYINKGENAKETLVREVKEEVGLDVVNYIYNDNVYFEKTNTLIHNYISFVEEENFILTEEVDFAKWYTIKEAIQTIRPHSLAKQFLLQILHKQGFSELLFQYDANSIYILDAYDQKVAEIVWNTKETTCEITHTFVNPSLRGQQIASKLTEKAIEVIQKQNKEVIPICSFVKKYMKK